MFINKGKRSAQRLVPISPRFVEHPAAYLEVERPADADYDAVFLVLKRRRLGPPLTAYWINKVMDGAWARAGLSHASCHALRGGDAIGRRSRPRAGHASILVDQDPFAPGG